MARMANPQTLFSAHAEVFPFIPKLLPAAVALLRARGGISVIGMGKCMGLVSSPRTRRYFPPSRPSATAKTLFSAHAEVFPTSGTTPKIAKTLLRARGGISGAEVIDITENLSSPRTRRYFLCRPIQGRRLALFSAHAEVFPSEQPTAPAYRPRLRARGGISRALVQS